MSGEQGGGVGPVVEEADDEPAAGADGAGGGVEDPPAQRLGGGPGERARQSEELEPADEVRGPTDQREPGLVGVEGPERHAAQPGVFEAGDVLFDVGVGAHVGVEGGGGRRSGRCSDPSSATARRGTGSAGRRVAAFAAHDQAGAGRPVGEVDEPGDVGHEGVVAGLAGGLVNEWSPGVVDVEAQQRSVDRRGGAGDHGEPDVAGPAGPHEAGAPGRVGPHPDLPPGQGWVVSGPCPAAISAGNWPIAWSRTLS